tara:strand:+ start:9473 stop:9742 length:270 start_codon:yes stop_codon:yes gene_type:complete
MKEISITDEELVEKILLFFLYIACYISYNMLFNFITPRPIGNKDTICIYNSTHDWKTRENQNIYGQVILFCRCGAEIGSEPKRFKFLVK